MHKGTWPKLSWRQDQPEPTLKSWPFLSTNPVLVTTKITTWAMSTNAPNSSPAGQKRLSLISVEFPVSQPSRPSSKPARYNLLTPTLTVARLNLEARQVRSTKTMSNSTNLMAIRSQGVEWNNSWLSGWPTIRPTPQTQTALLSDFPPETNTASLKLHCAASNLRLSLGGKELNRHEPLKMSANRSIVPPQRNNMCSRGNPLPSSYSATPHVKHKINASSTTENHGQISTQKKQQP